MKKSQILAALALAFALGVVIPVAGASAKISNNVVGEDVTAKETIKKMDQAIDDGKASCGYHLNTSSNAKEWYYDMYQTLSLDMDKAADAVEDAEEIALGNLKAAYKDQITWTINKINGAGAALDLTNYVEDKVPEDIDTYTKVVKFINNAVNTLKQVSLNYASNATVTNELNSRISLLNKSLKDTQDGVDYTKNAQAKIIERDIAAIKDEDFNESKTYNYAQAVKSAETLNYAENGTCSVAKYNNLYKAINYAIAMKKSESNFSSAKGEEAIANIKKAMNGGTITDEDVKPTEPGNTIKPGNTGALNSAAEGTASTTVSIVAGLATALTALGAGVVAYRNARRSSEN